MLIVPLEAIPNQSLQVQLANQAVELNIYQLAYGLFVDVYVDNVLIIPGVIAHNLCRIIRSLYFGFAGDFTFVDLEGSADPVYTGLGSRFQLIYLEQADLPAGEG